MDDKEFIKLITNIDSNRSNQRLEKAKKLLVSDFSLYHIEELTFDDESPKKRHLKMS